MQHPPAICKIWRKTIVFAAKFVPARGKYAARVLLEIAPLNSEGGNTHQFYWDAHRAHAVLTRFLDGNFKGWDEGERGGQVIYTYGSRTAGNEFAQTDTERRAMSLAASNGQLMVTIRRGPASGDMEARAITLDYWEAVTFAFTVVGLLNEWQAVWAQGIHRQPPLEERSYAPTDTEAPPPPLDEEESEKEEGAMELARARTGYEGYVSFARSKGLEIDPSVATLPSTVTTEEIRGRSVEIRQRAVDHMLATGQIEDEQQAMAVANAFVKEYIDSSL